MKTAVSALAEYLHRRQTDNVTERLNKVYSQQQAKLESPLLHAQTDLAPQGLVQVERIRRGEIWWADLPQCRRSESGYSRPVLIGQAGTFNRGRIQTVIVAVIADAPGNVPLPAELTGLPSDSVVNVSQLLTLDRSFLTEAVSTLSTRRQIAVDSGLRAVLQLR